MSDELERDEVVARALDAVAVPDYEPGFWDRLEARLAAEGFPGLGVSSLEEPSVPTEPPVPLTLVGLAPPLSTTDDAALGIARAEPPPAAAPAAPVEAAPVPAALAAAAPAARRRGVALLGAAAAVIVAVLALQLADDPPQDPLETAAPGGAVDERVASPEGGSTGPRARGGEAADEEDPEEAGSLDGASSGARSDLTGEHDGAEGSAPRSGTTARADGTGTTAFSARPTSSATATPQKAFATWAAALEAGEVEAAVAVTGPRTRRVHEAAGTELATVVEGWSADYAAWRDGAGGRIEEIEAAPSGDAPVVVLVLERALTGEEAPTGRVDLPVVLTADGWRVEPDARADVDAATVLAGPAPDGRSTSSTVPKQHVIEVPAAPTGTYTLDLDRREQATIPASKAVDGVIRWDPPDRAMTPGRHVVVVVHVTEHTITTSTLAFEVG